MVVIRHYVLESDVPALRKLVGKLGRELGEEDSVEIFDEEERWKPIIDRGWNYRYILQYDKDKNLVGFLEYMTGVVPNGILITNTYVDKSKRLGYVRLLYATLDMIHAHRYDNVRILARPGFEEKWIIHGYLPTELIISVDGQQLKVPVNNYPAIEQISTGGKPYKKEAYLLTKVFTHERRGM